MFDEKLEPPEVGNAHSVHRNVWVLDSSAVARVLLSLAALILISNRVTLSIVAVENGKTSPAEAL